ncbi:MAG TPA: PH domain-containing protein [Bacillota bacterium]|nr:PH domain-containing protein [Bacillota bacterium]HNY68676.1 PH domain-containing protein [Bacillota bacterium]HOI38509.1 PH domain-containing protein [Bacillota bacterium]
MKKQRDSYSIEPAGTLIAMMEVSLLPYCPECGAQFDAGAKFCAECGARLERVNASGQPSRVGGEPQAQQSEHVLWEGRPYLKEITTNTKYILTTQRLIIQMGLLGRREEQIDLGRVKDIRLTQGVSDRMIGIGQIEVISTDPSTPSFRLMGIRDPRTVRDLIWSAVNQRRSAMGIRPRELL